MTAGTVIGSYTFHKKMETPQNLPPSLIIFIFVSLILCIWSIVDIARSSFSKFNKVMWLLIVLFAPFGIFIYLLFGRRLKPVNPVSLPEGNQSADVERAGSRGPAESLPHRNAAWSYLTTMAVTALLCVITYLNIVTLVGREKTGWILLSAMVIVGMILMFLQLRRGRGK